MSVILPRYAMQTLIHQLANSSLVCLYPVRNPSDVPTTLSAFLVLSFKLAAASEYYEIQAVLAKRFRQPERSQHPAFD